MSARRAMRAGRAAVWVAAALASMAVGNAAAFESVGTLDPPVASPNTVTTAPTAAPNWQLIGRTETGCVQHWDPATRSTQGAYRKAWFMLSCEAPAPLDGDPRHAAYSVQLLIYANCAAHTLATAQTVHSAGMYGAGGGRTERGDVRPQGFSEPAPNSVTAGWLTLVCQKPPIRKPAPRR